MRGRKIALNYALQKNGISVYLRSGFLFCLRGKAAEEFAVLRARNTDLIQYQDNLLSQLLTF